MSSVSIASIFEVSKSSTALSLQFCSEPTTFVDKREFSRISVRILLDFSYFCVIVIMNKSTSILNVYAFH